LNASYIKDNDFKNAEWVNDKGCPGPETIDLDEVLNHSK